ncbi:APC family permease [Clostridium ganghwense]|uniref:Amino acid permease n=1 Tax=Clostridium ganghwense TaxID=312089 RepID=A0ABT4CUJ7_9CLOT|nr:amino acid permease [Clostridium ganghwense]MCY6371906.1 amino acid permease [Clostridium ganghwense]
MEKQVQLKKEIGLLTATALVAGNMIGSGIFMLPTTLASISGPGSIMIAWLITGLGSIFIALSCANLGSKISESGGPYQYSKRAFGNFIGFLVAWLYWNAACIGNAAIITTLVSYTIPLIPIIGENSTIAFIYASSVLWIFTFINILGVKKAGFAQAAITIFKIVLFGSFIVIAACNFNVEFITPAFPARRGLETLPAVVACTIWAFVGFESASVTAGEISNPERNVKLSTIFGISIAVIMYMLISFFAMGAMPQDQLVNSAAPIVDILSQFLGKGVTKIIVISMIICVFGSIIGWLLSTARMSFAAGKDKIFPQIFAKVHSQYNTPHASLIINAIFTNIVLLMSYSKSMISAFNFVILLTTLAYLPVYALTSLADIKFKIKESNLNKFSIIKSCIVPFLGFSYAIWAISGLNKEVILYGMLLAIIGIPFYFYCKWKNNKEETKKFIGAA